MSVGSRALNLLPNEIVCNRENVRLIWFDDNIDDSIQTTLLELNPAALFYTDPDRCGTVIKLIKHDRILLIVSASFARHILSQIHRYRSLSAVCIVSPNDPIDWKSEYNKIIEIFSDRELLVKSIHRLIHFVEEQTFTFSRLNPKLKYTGDMTSELVSFLWYQLLIDTFKQMPQNEQFKKDILDKCQDYYSRNQQESAKIDQFRKTYTRETAIEWYMNPCFLYKVLNRALRTKDMELLDSFRYFIIDISDGMKKLTEQELSAYRGQIMSKDNLEKLQQGVGMLISMNGFFSASLNRNNSIHSAKQSLISDAYQSVLFQIELNSMQNTLIFVDTKQEQVLFNLDVVFRIELVEFDSSLDLWIVKLIGTDDNFVAVQIYLESIKQFFRENSLLIFFGRLLIELEQQNRAESYFAMLLNSLPADHADVASIYNQIGNFYAAKGDYKLALTNYERGYQISQERLTTDHPHIAVSLNNIGLIYKDEGNLQKALELCLQALMIDEKNYPGDHVLKAMTIENIGGIYKEIGFLAQAQVYLLRAFGIYKRVLHADHPLVADALNTIGKIYCEQGYFDRALGCYRQALIISEKNYPDEHLQKAQTFENIALLYKTTGNLDQAIQHLTTALDMYNRVLSSPHPDIGRCLGHIGLVYEASENFEQALNYFYKQLDMDELCLPNDHPILKIDIDWIVDVYKKKGETTKAFEFCREKFQIKKNALGENHPIVVSIFMRMTEVCDDSLTKQEFYKQALIMYENMVPSDRRATIQCLDEMVKFYSQCQQIENALIYQLRMIELQKQILPDDNIELAISLRKLGEFYEATSQTTKAETCYATSRSIIRKYKNSPDEIDLQDTKKSQLSNGSHIYHSTLCTVL